MKTVKAQEATDLVKIFTDSFAPKGETFRENRRKDMFEALQELERLAEIGRATVAQYKKGFMLIKQKGNLTTAFLTVEDIVDWHNQEDHNE